MNFLKNSSVAVTGGCGFIGSHLVQSLRRHGARVLAIDSLQYGKPDNVDASDPEIQIEQLELRGGTAETLRQLLRGVDYVFHLAAEKHNQSINAPERVLDANVLGTYELLEAATAAGVRKTVFTSSLYAYGRMSGPPMSEDEVPVPHTVYGISKLTGEGLCRHFAVHRGLAAICLRLFFVYGPRQYSGLGYKSVIVNNFGRLLNRQKPIVYGDGSQELDYIYIDDVVSALLLAVTMDSRFDVLNVGSGCAITIGDLTALMMKVAGVKSACEYRPPDFTHDSSRVANTEKFAERFGPQSRIPLEEGLRRTFEWIKAAKG